MDRNWVNVGRGSNINQRLRRAQALRTHPGVSKQVKLAARHAWVRGLILTHSRCVCWTMISSLSVPISSVKWR